MYKLAFNPATGTPKKGNAINAIAKAEAGLASLKKDEYESNIAYHKDNIANYQRNIRSQEEALKRAEDLLATLKDGTAATIKKEIKEKIKGMDVFQRGLIQKIEADGSYLYITTAMLAFYPGTPLYDYNVTKKTNIGRFLIKLDINYTSTSMVRGIINLNYRGDYHTPTITTSNICWGRSEGELEDLTQRRDILGIIDFLINYIMSPNDQSGYTSWGSIFRNRESIKRNEVKGRPCGRLQCGDWVLPITRPLTLADFKKVIKSTTYYDIDRVSQDGDFVRLTYINSNLPDIYLSHASTIIFKNNAGSMGVHRTENKIKPKYINKLARLMFEEDKRLGYIPE